MGNDRDRNHGRNGGKFRSQHNRYIVESQVIVSGSEAVIQSVLSDLDDVESQPIRILRMSELGASVVQSLELVPDAVIGLYLLTGSAPDVRRAIRLITESLGAVPLEDDRPDRRGRKPRGEPNFLIGRPWDGEGSPWDGEGSPWDGEGSPWDGEGSPWDGEGSPWDGEGSPWHRRRDKKEKQRSTLPVAEPEWFMKQWAFQTIGLDNPAVGPLPTAQRQVTGSGVRVAVLDTSPYFPSMPEGSRAQYVSHLAQPAAEMVLNVYHPPMRAPEVHSDKRTSDLRNHGYFIAGLLHAIAPGSELHLIRVLDHDSRGDLFTLEEALFDFVKGVVDNPPPRGAVINLSLGICVPPQEEDQELPDELLSLHLILQAARSLGVLVVGAAGNDGNGEVDARRQEIPASWENVLGVAACNRDLVRSCFSNCGDIAAPGGDGRSTIQSDGACRSRNAECVDENAASALIGPVLVRFPEPAGLQTRYLFWSGSSFSAPLVSGLAALVMEVGEECSPQAVERAIREGAVHVDDQALGAGVINVRSTLSAFTG